MTKFLEFKPLFLIICLSLFFNFGGNALANSETENICFDRHRNSEDYFLKNNLRHRIDSFYAMEALGGCDDYRYQWEEGLNFPEKEPIKLNQAICYLAENQQKCKGLVKDYLKVIKSSSIAEAKRSEFISFDFESFCDDAEHKDCHFLIPVNRNDIKNCQNKLDSQDCIEKLVLQACKPINSFKAENLNSCYTFFSKELNNPRLCKLNEVYGDDPPHVDVSLCYKRVAIENNNVDLCGSVINTPSKPRDYCYKKLAVKNKDSDICDRVEDAYVKSSCYFKLAEKTKDQLLCDKAKRHEFQCSKLFGHGWGVFNNFNLKRIIYILFFLGSGIFCIIFSLLKLKTEYSRPKKYFYITMLIGGFYLAWAALWVFDMQEIYIEDRTFFGYLIYFFLAVDLIFIFILNHLTDHLYQTQMNLILFSFNFSLILLFGHIWYKINSIKRKWLRIIANVLLIGFFILNLVINKIVAIILENWPT